MAKKAGFDIKYEPEDYAKVKLNAGFDTETNYFLAETILDYSRALTPYDPLSNHGPQRHWTVGSRHLRDSAKITSTKTGATITYPGVRYAKRQYTGDNYNHTTPGTTARWIEIAFTSFKQNITGTLGAHIRWKSR